MNEKTVLSVGCSWQRVYSIIAEDSVYLVLWYKDGNPQPVYSYDARFNVYFTEEYVYLCM